MRLRHTLLLAFALVASGPVLAQDAAPAAAQPAAEAAPGAAPQLARPAAKPKPKPKPKPAAKLSRRPAAPAPNPALDPTTPEANGWGAGQPDPGVAVGRAPQGAQELADPSSTASARPDQGLAPCAPDSASEVRPSCVQPAPPPAPKAASENPAGCVVFTSEPASASQYPFTIRNRCRFAVEFRARICTEDWTKPSQPLSCVMSPEPLYLSAGSGYSGHSDVRPAQLVSVCSARSGECMHAGPKPVRRKPAVAAGRPTPKPPAAAASAQPAVQ
ncbi:hypothetical protein [Alsobacter sp. SYSU BS001988]